MAGEHRLAIRRRRVRDVAEIRVFSLIQHYPNFNTRLRDSLGELVGEEVEKKVEIGLAKDGSGVGGASSGSRQVGPCLINLAPCSCAVRPPGYQARSLVLFRRQQCWFPTQKGIEGAE